MITAWLVLVFIFIGLGLCISWVSVIGFFIDGSDSDVKLLARVGLGAILLSPLAPLLVAVAVGYAVYVVLALALGSNPRQPWALFD